MPVRRLFCFCILLAGCSTSPLVDMCDYFQPGRLYRDKVTPYGGVCVMQRGEIAGTPPGVMPVNPPVVPPPVVMPPPPPGGPISIPTLPPPTMPK